MAQKRRPAGSGAVRQLPSGRWQARHVGPDGLQRPAPVTFDTKLDATSWLAEQQRRVAAGIWSPPESSAASPGRAAAAPTLREYVDVWLSGRRIRPTTRAQYESFLRGHILPPLGDLRIDEVTPFVVRRWRDQVAPGRETTAAKTYLLLASIMGDAVRDGVIDRSPCTIRGGGRIERQHDVVVLSAHDIRALEEAMPERMRLLVTLGAWCALRYGEAAELRRSDVDLDAGVIRVRRAMTYVDGTVRVGAPKTRAGSRDVEIPPHVAPAVARHLELHAATGAGGLLVHDGAGDHLRHSSFSWHFDKARRAIGRPTFRFHDLRHTGLTLLGRAGATVAELMDKAGHSSPAAALHYQHSTAERQRELAARLSLLAAEA